MAAVFLCMLGVTGNLTPSDWRLYDGSKQITDEGYVVHCKLGIRIYNKYRERE